ncbi:MAG: SDR family NAD(P)-dependent oxidoreductase [Myxococcales bacterium]|nr:SDR family NAD(P)-dependent oxidoreductase [Myxococcales bacterium]
MTTPIALVTGGTSGVGRSIVRALVDRGMHVHFIGTNAERGTTQAADLNASGPGSSTFIPCDLSDLPAVRTFARQFRDDVPALSLLLNVAGVVLPKRQVTPEGIEKTFAVGYLSAMILISELSPALAQATTPRILNVSGSPGIVLSPDRLNFEDLMAQTNYNAVRAAMNTVHAKTVATEIWADKLKDQGIDVNAFHPGAVKGQLGRSMPWPLRTLFSVGNLFLSPETISGIHVSTAPELQGITGHYFIGKTSRALSFDPAYKKALWTETERLLAAN